MIARDVICLAAICLLSMDVAAQQRQNTSAQVRKRQYEMIVSNQGNSGVVQSFSLYIAEELQKREASAAEIEQANPDDRRLADANAWVDWYRQQDVILKDMGSLYRERVGLDLKRDAASQERKAHLTTRIGDLATQLQTIRENPPNTR